MMNVLVTGNRKRTKFDAVLTAVNPNEPWRPQLDVFKQWLPSTANVIALGNVKYDGSTIFGLEIHEPRVDSGTGYPTVKELVNTYMARNPVDEVVAICQPDLILAPDPSALFTFMDSAGTGRAWAFNCPNQKNEARSDLFVVTSSVMQYIQKSVPADLLIENDDWMNWLHQWFTLNMPKHRYLNANQFNLISGHAKPFMEASSIHSVNAFANQTLDEIAHLRPWARRDMAITPQIKATVVDCKVPDDDTPKVEQNPIKAKKRGRPKKMVK